MHEPTATVIIPAFNAAETMDSCLGSLRELRYPTDKLELLVVDNGSTDGTRALLQRHGDGVVVAEEPRRGPAAARNAGLARARGEVVAFTDADCEVDPDWLRQLVEPLSDDEVGIVGGTILARRPASQIELFGEAIHDHERAIRAYRPPYAITMSWASRRDVLRKAGGFDERFRRCEDVELSYRLIQAGYRLEFTPGAVVHHRNESRLRGLFCEGFLHGFYGVRARKRHRDYLRGLGHGRLSRPGYREVGVRLLRSLREAEGDRGRCDAIFNSGKKVGKLLGSARFGHVDL